jgi:GGDEF domain-containing protein
MRHDLLQRALTDAETGLPNRRFLDLERTRVLARSQRYGSPVGIITITCPGCAADVLRRFGHAAAQTVRRADFLARTGPSELQLLVTHRDTEGLPAVVDRLPCPGRGFADEDLPIEVQWTVEDAPGTATGQEPREGRVARCSPGPEGSAACVTRHGEG